MPGLFATLGLDGSKYKAEWEKIIARNESGQAQMASAAKFSSAIQIKAIQAQMDAAEAGSIQWEALAVERGRAEAKFAAAHEVEVRRFIALEGKANAAANESAEIRESAAIHGEAVR